VRTDFKAEVAIEYSTKGVSEKCLYNVGCELVSVDPRWGSEWDL